MSSYLRHITHFAHAVEAGSITAAVNRAGLSPSAISESVKAVEKYYGQPALERARQGVTSIARGWPQ